MLLAVFGTTHSTFGFGLAEWASGSVDVVKRGVRCLIVTRAENERYCTRSLVYHPGLDSTKRRLSIPILTQVYVAYLRCKTSDSATATPSTLVPYVRVTDAVASSVAPKKFSTDSDRVNTVPTSKAVTFSVAIREPLNGANAL